MWITYILYSKAADRYYIGQTSDLAARMRQHVEGNTRSTKHATDWSLVFSEEFSSLQEAMVLERQIKKAKSRKSIGRYIANTRNMTRDAVALAAFCGA